MTQREHIGVDVRGGTMRATLDLPQRPVGSRVPAVVIDRGLASGEADGDALETLATALAGIGMLAVRAEPRATQLILDDFDRFSATDAADDLLALAQLVSQRSDVDAMRFGLIGWSIGAISAANVARRLPSIARLCLINPVTPAYLASRVQRSDSQTRFAGEALPRTFADKLQEMDTVNDAAASDRPTLIVHAAADRVVPASVSLEFLPAMDRENRPFERVLVARADHAFSDESTRAVLLDHVLRHFAGPAPAGARRTVAGASA